MELVTLVLACVLVNNVALTAFGGLDTLAVSKRKKIDVKTLACASAIVIACSATVNYFLNSVLASIGVSYLTTLVDVAVVLLVATAVENCTKLKLGKFAVLTVLNGAALTLSLAGAEGALAAVLAAVASGVGFAVAMLVYRDLRTGINDKYVPASFRGLPVDLLVIAIMAMAVTAFK